MGMPHPVHSHQSCNLPFPCRTYTRRPRTLCPEETRLHLPHMSGDCHYRAWSGHHPHLLQSGHTHGSHGSSMSLWHPRASIDPNMAANMFVDLVLTGVFFYLLRPAARPESRSTSSYALKNQGNIILPLVPTDTNETTAQRNIRALLWKSIVGSLLIEIPMTANMIQFVITRGEELGTICMALCVVEGKLQAIDM
jgi:hypothetical protein